MPHLPGEDDGRTLGAPAERAAGPAPPVTTRGRLFIVSGPSGAGKGTLIAGTVKRFPQLQVAISATTRQPRAGEVDGVDYHFLSHEDFEARVAAGAFLEHVVYSGNRYGTLRSEIDGPLASGRSVMLEIELNGARAVRAERPDAVSIFIAPGSREVLRARLLLRGTEDEREIAMRLAAGDVELAAAKEFDHVIVNEQQQVEPAIEALVRIVADTIGSAPVPATA